MLLQDIRPIVQHGPEDLHLKLGSTTRNLLFLFTTVLWCEFNFLFSSSSTTTTFEAEKEKEEQQRPPSKERKRSRERERSNSVRPCKGCVQQDNGSSLQASNVLNFTQSFPLLMTRKSIGYEHRLCVNSNRFDYCI